MKYTISITEAKKHGLLSNEKPTIETVEIFQNGESVQCRYITCLMATSLDALEKWKLSKKLKCLRCGHDWESILVTGSPRSCPACKSPYWDRPSRTNARYVTMWHCAKGCGMKTPIDGNITASTCPDCGHTREVINEMQGYVRGSGKNDRNYTITPMIIEKDGKMYRVEFVCHHCNVVWPKDTETLNVHCPTCRRKCGADSRRVELGVSGEVTDGQE